MNKVENITRCEGCEGRVAIVIKDNDKNLCEGCYNFKNK